MKTESNGSTDMADKCSAEAYKNLSSIWICISMLLLGWAFGGMDGFSLNKVIEKFEISSDTKYIYLLMFSSLISIGAWIVVAGKHRLLGEIFISLGFLIILSPTMFLMFGIEETNNLASGLLVFGTFYFIAAASVLFANLFCVFILRLKSKYGKTK